MFQGGCRHPAGRGRLGLDVYSTEVDKVVLFSQWRDTEGRTGERSAGTNEDEGHGKQSKAVPADKLGGRFEARTINDPPQKKIVKLR